MLRLTVLLILMGTCLACEPAAPAEAPADPPPAQPTALAESAAPRVVSDSTRAVFERVMARARAENLHARPLGEIIQTMGSWFAGTPYVEGLLDAPDEETLVLNLEGFDCVLFVESMLALARGVAVEDYAFASFARRIEEQRYRDGQLDGYCSRLHYFTDWIADNARRGIVRDITADLGGEAREKRLTFMGTHRDSYRHLTDDANYQCILDREADLAGLTHVHVPQDRIRDVYDRLRAGDIIATSTPIEGLDVTHTGFVYERPDGGRGFMHASSSGEVKISPDLQDYVEGVKVQYGILVARPLDERASGG